MEFNGTAYRAQRRLRVVKKQLALLFGLEGLSFVSACGQILLAIVASVIAWFTVALIFTFN
jgi:hypothetical protein